jgi:hypothetical protein
MIIEIILGVAFPLYILVELFRINILKKDNNALFAGLISLMSIGFGLYLSVWYGLIFEYGTLEEISSSNAEIKSTLGQIDIVTGFIFVLISISKWLIWIIRK